jgi:hypothetical protein
MAVFQKIEDIMRDFDDRENILWSVAVQHFQKSFINEAKETPFFNALGQGKYDLVSE